MPALHSFEHPEEVAGCLGHRNGGFAHGSEGSRRWRGGKADSSERMSRFTRGAAAHVTGICAEGGARAGLSSHSLQCRRIFSITSVWCRSCLRRGFGRQALKAIFISAPHLGQQIGSDSYSRPLAGTGASAGRPNRMPGAEPMPWPTPWRASKRFNDGGPGRCIAKVAHEAGNKRHPRMLQVTTRATLSARAGQNSNQPSKP